MHRRSKSYINFLITIIVFHFLKKGSVAADLRGVVPHEQETALVHMHGSKADSDLVCDWEEYCQAQFTKLTTKFGMKPEDVMVMATVDLAALADLDLDSLDWGQPKILRRARNILAQGVHNNCRELPAGRAISDELPEIARHFIDDLDGEQVHHYIKIYQTLLGASQEVINDFWKETDAGLGQFYGKAK